MKTTLLCSFALLAAVAAVGCMTDTDTDTDTDSTTEDAVARKACAQTQACAIGEAWDSRACACVPAERTCGPSLSCHHGDHCCAPTPADDVFYCAGATEVCQ